VPSRALQRWKNDAQDALDEIEDAHRAVGGGGRGRRFATLQVNHAYVTLLSSQFQGFCRDLHTEAVALVVGAVTPPVLSPIIQNLFVQGRKLDQGNPNPGNLGSDFGRLGMAFWPAVVALNAQNAARQTKLETLNTWRNAVAHQDWSRVGGPTLWLNQVQAWRRTCRALAKQFDTAVGSHLRGLVGRRPW
jgi:hypothetical protein